MQQPVKPADLKPIIAVNLTPAMSGYFATLYDWSWMEGGKNIHGETYEGHWFPEPYDTGMGRYPTWEQANAEGKLWAEQLGVEFRPATAEAVAAAEARAEQSRLKVARIKELRESGLDLRQAWEQAKAEFPDPT